jgi:hypothetical protein
MGTFFRLAQCQPTDRPGEQLAEALEGDDLADATFAEARVERSRFGQSGDEPFRGDFALA